MRWPKYRNQKTECLCKHLHDSKLEANYCNRLLAMKQNKEISAYETQVTYEMLVNEIKICKHIVDFVVVNKDKTCEVHECKSIATKTPAWSIKHKLFKALFPSHKYVIITKH